MHRARRPFTHRMTDQLAHHDGIRLAFQHSRHAGILVAPDGPRWTILEVNDAYLAVTHRTRASLLGQPLFEQFPESVATRNDGGSRTDALLDPIRLLLEIV